MARFGKPESFRKYPRTEESGEDFFAAEDDVYGVEAHGFRVACRLVLVSRLGAPCLVSETWVCKMAA